MAIIVEEEGNKSNAVSLLGWVIILGIIGAAVYYIFFVSPGASVITPPAGFEDITPIASVQFDPTAVIGSQSFQSLKQYITEPTSTGPTAVGRPDPFLSP